MSNLIHEELFPVREVTKHPAFRAANGKPCHFSKVHRAVLTGTKGADGRIIKLETLKCPGGRRTSREAIERFLANLNGSDATAPTPSTVAAQHARAERALLSAGL